MTHISHRMSLLHLGYQNWCQLGDHPQFLSNCSVPNQGLRFDTCFDRNDEFPSLDQGTDGGDFPQTNGQRDRQ